jgi:hypothetical protein
MDTEGDRQRHAVQVAGTNKGTRIWVSNSFYNSATPGTAVKGSLPTNGGFSLTVSGNDGGIASVSPAASGTVTPDPYEQQETRITMPAGNITIANPANAHYGCRLVITIKQDSVGSRTVTWGSEYRFAGGVAAPTLSTSPDRSDIFTFERWSSTWVEVGRSMNVLP